MYLELLVVIRLVFTIPNRRFVFRDIDIDVIVVVVLFYFCIRSCFDSGRMVVFRFRLISVTASHSLLSGRGFAFVVQHFGALSCVCLFVAICL